MVKVVDKAQSLKIGKLEVGVDMSMELVRETDKPRRGQRYGGLCRRNIPLCYWSLKFKPRPLFLCSIGLHTVVACNCNASGFIYYQESSKISP
jgi:hypothetical protein